jgi:hypothetical protein
MIKMKDLVIQSFQKNYRLTDENAVAYYNHWRSGFPITLTHEAKTFR